MSPRYPSKLFPLFIPPHVAWFLGTLFIVRSWDVQVRECLDEYAFVYIFSVQNMRNAKLKDVRNEWKHSRFASEDQHEALLWFLGLAVVLTNVPALPWRRFFFGKNKVMAVAIGREPEDEYKPQAHRITQV